ncbi:hypothetical protein [Qipengyuania qiaonensis]|uniref:Uncharacterized protein n=1 Tax=Qipengyuania qiaonensis TaxID=2867240 RepID=A0ABS7J7N9_9SPHN|nr:hypothetical protein [Qipengyuania qiaonensis]MBX7483340.1 hypothetical protein [Qipengyuania qiaonensis]
MGNAGRRQVVTDSDGWNVRTRDGSLSAQFEHTKAVTDAGFKMSTLKERETLPALVRGRRSELRAALWGVRF